MAGSLELPRTIRRSDIRRDGRALGYRDDDLEDFYLIVRIVDRHFVEIESRAAVDAAKRNADKAKQKR